MDQMGKAKELQVLLFKTPAMTKPAGCVGNLTHCVFKHLGLMRWEFIAAAPQQQIITSHVEAGSGLEQKLSGCAHVNTPSSSSVPVDPDLSPMQGITGGGHGPGCQFLS